MARELAESKRGGLYDRNFHRCPFPVSSSRLNEDFAGADVRVAAIRVKIKERKRKFK